MSLPTFDQDLAAVDSGSPQPPSTTAAMPPPVNNLRLVFNGDILLLALFACVVVLSMPRAFARLASGWHQGHILRSVSTDNKRSRKTTNATYSGNGMDMKSDVSHTYYSHTNLVQHEKGRASPAFPHHVPTVSSTLHPIAALLRRRIVPGFSIGQALILALYSGILHYLSLYNSNIFTDPDRTGFVAMSQIPVVFAFATKNNLLGTLIGFGYEKTNYLHRFAGRALMVLVNIHAIGYVYKWTAKGDFVTNASQPSVAWGFVALACLDVMTITSTAFIRQTSYRLFFNTHVTCFVIFLPAVCYHKTAIIPYVFAAVALYGLDHLVRLVKMRICTARIRPLPELSTTRIEIPQLNAGWRAGQHVRLRVLSSGMGWSGWMENHPFTIASVSNTEEGLVLMCKKMGKWTNKLYDMAVASGYGEGGKGTGGNVKVMIEGPYSGPGHSVFASYSAAVFVCGGGGISFGLSAVQDLVQKDLEGTSRVKVIELIWTIQDPASLVPLIPLFTSIIQQCTFTSINISIFYTRATPGLVRITKDYLLPGLALTPGRPRVAKVLDSVISRAVALGSGAKDSEALSGVVVGACGPVGLADDVSRAVGQVDSRRRTAVGGIELHEEVFGW